MGNKSITQGALDLGDQHLGMQLYWRWFQTDAVLLTLNCFGPAQLSQTCPTWCSTWTTTLSTGRAWTSVDYTAYAPLPSRQGASGRSTHTAGPSPHLPPAEPRPHCGGLRATRCARTPCPAFLYSPPPSPPTIPLHSPLNRERENGKRDCRRLADCIEGEQIQLKQRKES